MRSQFHLIRGPGLDEAFDTLQALAERVHQLRGERQIHLAEQAIGHSDGPSGDCVTLRAGDDREELIGYALFPEHPAYQGSGARARLVKALLDQRPQEPRTSDGELIVFGGRAA